MVVKKTDRFNFFCTIKGCWKNHSFHFLRYMKDRHKQKDEKRNIFKIEHTHTQASTELDGCMHKNT